MRKLVSAILSGVVMLQSFGAARAAQPVQATGAEQRQSQEFAFKLFRQTADTAQSNVVLSPFSVSSALSMAMNGAQGKTLDEMRTTLGFGSASVEQVNQQNRDVMESLLKINPQSELNIANALFAKQDVDFKASFINKVKSAYQAKLESLDFRNPASLHTINSWVSAQTKGKITSIVDKIPTDAILYLVNAIYFKGTWLEKFDPAQTQPQDFTKRDGTKVQVQMMNDYGKMSHFKGPNFQAVMLPYKDRRLQMVVMLPDEKVDIATFIAGLTADKWQSWTSQFGRHQGHLGLPRFKVEYKIELSNALKAAGMPCAFMDKCADFKAMVDDEVIISRVLHKTFMEVNETGTEAAAVTAVEMSVTSAPINPVPPFNMVCDRPFVVAITDSQTGAILFLGAIVDPGR